MATAEIAPIVESKLLEPGVTLAARATLTNAAEDGLFAIPTELEAPAPSASEMSVEFTQSGAKVTVTAVPEIPSARLPSVLFGALVHPNLRLRKAIPLQVTEEEGHVVLSWEEAGEFACGETMGEALDDFAKTISELYFELNAPQVRLGEHLERTRFILNDYIGPR